MTIKATMKEIMRNDEGMTTIEYALGCLAAAAFAAVLYAIVKGGTVRDALESLITNALNTM
ncbi:MAG: DUF4244 domain-containing protein [Corynebacterium sp.]|nr:DUF4244 domain-containing protein [Corynebacterium sp.]